jgi:hypothetical protein
MLLRYFPDDFEVLPVAFIVTGITVWTFAWRDCRKPAKYSVRVAGMRT